MLTGIIYQRQSSNSFFLTLHIYFRPIINQLITRQNSSPLHFKIFYIDFFYSPAQVKKEYNGIRTPRGLFSVSNEMSPSGRSYSPGTQLRKRSLLQKTIQFKPRLQKYNSKWATFNVRCFKWIKPGNKLIVCYQKA